MSGAGGGHDSVRVVRAERDDFGVAGAVGLVQDDEFRHFPCPDVLQHFPDGLDLALRVRIRRVDDVQQEIRLD